MGIGFLEDEPAQTVCSPLPDDIVIPSSMFGLNPRQMLAMGIAGDDVQRLQTNLSEVCFILLPNCAVIDVKLLGRVFWPLHIFQVRSISLSPCSSPLAALLPHTQASHALLRPFD
jgi:hypothetical protein